MSLIGEMRSAVTSVLAALTVLVGVLALGQLAVLSATVIACAASTWIALGAAFSLRNKTDERHRSAMDAAALAYTYFLMTSLTISFVLYTSASDTLRFMPVLPVATSILLAALAAGFCPLRVPTDGASHRVHAAMDICMVIFILASVRGVVDLSSVSLWHAATVLFVGMLTVGILSIDASVTALELAVEAAPVAPPTDECTV